MRARAQLRARLFNQRRGFLQRGGRDRGGGLAGRLAQRLDLVGLLPGDVRVVLAEVAVVGRLGIDRAQQVELLDDRRRLEAEHLAHDALEFLVAHHAGAERVDAHGNRVGIADGVGKLNLRARGQARGDDVLGHVTAHVGRAAVHLGRVFAAEATAAVPPHAAVAVHDDLAARQPGVALRPAHHKPPGRVDQVNGLLVQQMRGQDLLDDFVDDEALDGSVLHVRRVLRRYHDVGDAHGLVIDILDGDLALGVRPQPFDRPGLANAGQLAPKLVREHDRRGHQFRRLVRRVAEHQTLVARPLLGRLLAFRGLGIHALRDVGALRGDGVQDQHPVRVKDIVVMRVTDLADRLAGNRIEVRLRLGRDFTAHHDQVALGVGLAGHAAARVLRQAGVQHRIGNGIAHFVRVALADGLGRKDVVLAH